MATELSESCVSHIKAAGMDTKKYKKIATFVDNIINKQKAGNKTPNQDVLLEQFAAKCYKSFPVADGLRQAEKFLKVLFGDDLSKLVAQGSGKALEAAAANSADITRIVRLNRPVGGFTKKLDKYLIGETLGKGATSKVKLGRNEETGEEVALKILTGGKNFNQEDLKKEIEILMKLDHKNVIRVYDYFDNVEALGSGSGQKTTTVIVLELATKGELFDFFMYTGFFEPPLARWFFKQMVEGLGYCHDQGIAHRDLKPENCLLGNNYEVKLVDFGFATSFKNAQGENFKMVTALGTPGYAAPEILKRSKYDNAVDIFSLGVILFITIAGFPPFQEAKAEADWWFHKLKTKRFDLFWKAHERTAKFTPEAKEILLGMLAADPAERWTISKIKNSKWWNQKTLTQQEAVDALLKRKKKVEKEKIAKDQEDPLKGEHRGDNTIHAPPMKMYRPANLFYCSPDKCADDIRSLLVDAVSQESMGNVEKEYYATGDVEAPVCPDGVEQKEWKPWWDFTFTTQLKETLGELTMTHKFEGGVYIREDTSYVPPASNPEWRRNAVYFKRHSGPAHKWMKVMFKLQLMVGFFHTEAPAEPTSSAIPDVSPIKLEVEPIAA